MQHTSTTVTNKRPASYYVVDSDKSTNCDPYLDRQRLAVGSVCTRHIHKARNLSSHMTCSPMPAAAAAAAHRPLRWQPCDVDDFRNPVTLTFDVLTSESMRVPSS